MEKIESNTEEEDFLVAMNVKLRNYQLTLIDCAKRQNSILLLPAGAGKTLIAVHVLCSKTTEIIGEFPDRGKRAFFVAPTRVLVTQLHKILSIHTKFKVKLFLGDKVLDSWSRDQWLEQLRSNEVIVLTGEILRQILELKYILPCQISLIVFDECHHAILQHPFNLILQQINQEPLKSAPLVLGLSAVLLNANPKKKDVQNMIAKMKNSFRGIILTSDLDDLMRFTAKPKEKFVPYVLSPELSQQFLPLYDETIYYLDEIELVPSDAQPIPKTSRFFKNLNRARKFKNWFVNAKEILEEYGIYCGSLAALYYIILVEKTRLMTTDNLEMNVLIYCRTALYKIRKLLLRAMGEDTYSNIYKNSTDKIQTFLSLLLNINENSQKKDLSTLIFVRRKVTAVTVATMLKKLRDINSSFRFLRPEFIIGTNILDKESLMHELSNDQIVKEFSCQNLNTLVSTSLLEEGIDIKTCNLVMNFDFPVSYSSYFQTKGRARDREGSYYVFVNENELDRKRLLLNEYRQIEEELYKIISADAKNYEIYSDNRQMYLDGLEDEIDEFSSLAILAVYRYCSKLPQDKYSFLAPLAWYVEVDGGKKASVQLPINSPLQEIIEGGVFPNAKLAKKSAFLETLNKLKEIGEVDENCNPATLGSQLQSFDYLFPYYKDETFEKDAPLPGTKKKKQIYKSKFAESLSECLPQPGEKAYIHVIDFAFQLEDVDRPDKLKLQEVLQLPVTFAILSSKKLFEICPFEMYSDLAKINCNLLINYDEIVLSKTELEDIKLCHLTVFNKVLKNTKNFQIFDNKNKGHSFYVVPVFKNEFGRFVLDWNVISSDFCRDNKLAIVTYNPTRGRFMKKNIDYVKSEQLSHVEASCAVVPLSEGENRHFYMASAAWDESNQRPRFVMSETAYKNFIVYPNYRNLNSQVYIVSEVCHNLTPLSPFPNSTYQDYYSYYQEKYMLEISNLNQPLIKVAPVFNCCNFNKPKPKGKEKKRRLHKVYEELFIPELCDIILFDKRYWLKAILLPSVLNRVCNLYYMEEFRRKIVKDTGLGTIDLPPDVEQKPLKADFSLKKNESEEEEDSVTLDMSLPLSQLKLEHKRNSALYMEIKRNILDVGVCDLEYMVSFLEKAKSKENSDSFLDPEIDNEMITQGKLRNFVVPSLEAIAKKKNQIGPSLSMICQALTSLSVNDGVNYERLEILGDSFLKFAVSTFLFKNFDKNEGVLATLKAKLIGNRNLYYCGTAKGFQDALNVTDFSPMFDWNPPLLCLPEELVEDVISNNIDPSVIYEWDISAQERSSGNLSNETLSKNKEITLGYDKNFSEGLNGFFPYKIIPDKTISDSVEAVIGVYLIEFGFFGGLEMLGWLGILPKDLGSYSELMEKKFTPKIFPKCDASSVMNILNEVFYKDLERTLCYEFKNKALLLEAITHPTYALNRVTDCYQRLEFLGDAILDFLITCYIYQHCGEKTPGEVTDIRSALVNNITFASLSVRYGFQKYLLKLSARLNSAIEEFVSHQISQNHKIADNEILFPDGPTGVCDPKSKVLILLQEDECGVTEAVQVPKALGDIFESLAAAIFIDSGNSLETVWNVFYRLMKEPIDNFTKNPPKDPVRLLYEICKNRPRFEVTLMDSKVEVKLSVRYESTEIKVSGIGKNKKEAKRSAAKFAVTKIADFLLKSQKK